MNVGILKHQIEKPRAPTDWERAAASRIANLRMRLLDLTNSNRLLNFKFRDRSRSYVRVIEAVPDAVFSRLADGERFQFRSLPEKTDEPTDEETEQFLLALDQARLSDTLYRDQLNALEDDPEGAETRRIERQLKDRVRAQIGLPPLSEVKEPSLAEYARLHGIDPRFDLTTKSKNGSEEKRYLQLLLLPEQMERSLSGISDQSRTTLQEKGVNTLCVAFGYLEWYESDSSEKVMYAPLLLQEVDIERKLSLYKYQYTIGSLGEDIDINVTLSDRLARDFGLRLPSFEEEDTPECYFSRFEKIIHDHPRWRVRRFVVVGHFAFARLVMYNDVDPKLWPGNVGIVGNANILKLFAGGGEEGQASDFVAEEYEVDSPNVSSKVPLLITEADSSQFSAIVDVMDKKNIAIKGPPGTGKSQTITNIIAAALAKGLRVLFVAEKMAALDVVKDRLAKAGLGDFCFELHSTKSRKKDVLASLEARLDIQGTLQPPRQLDVALAELQKLRSQLTDYVSVINKEFGKSGKTIHNILWSEQRSRNDRNQLPKKIDDIRLPNVDALIETDLEARRMKLDALGEIDQTIIASYGSVNRHPWHGVEAVELSLFDQEDVINFSAELSAALEAFLSVALSFNTEIGAPIVSDIAAANRITVGLNRMPTYLPEVDKTPLVKLAEATNREALRNLLGSITCLTKANKSLSDIGDIEQMRAQASALSHLVEAVHKFNLAKETRISLGCFIEKLEDQTSKWRQAAQFGQILFDEFGLTGDGLDLSILRRLTAAIRQLSRLPRRLLGLRGDKLTQAENGVLLQEGADKAKAIKSALAGFERRFTFARNENPDTLRQCAAVLRSSGLFGSFRAEVRTAKRKYRSLLKTPEKTSRARMTDELDQMGDILSAARMFKLDATLRSICGSQFRGIETPFDDLIIVHRWMVATEAAIGNSDRTDQQIKNVLLMQPTERLKRLLEFLEGHSAYALFERLLEETSDSEGTIEHRIESLDTRIEAAKGADRTSSQIGLLDKIPFGRLDEAVEAMNAIGKAEDEITTNENAQKVLDRLYQGPATDPIVLKELINIADGIAESGLPEPIKLYLLSDKFNQRVGRLCSLHDELEKTKEKVCRTWMAFQEKAAVDEIGFFGEKFETGPINTLLDRVKTTVDEQNALATWIEYCRAWKDCADLELLAFLETFDSQLKPATLRKGFDRIYYRSLARSVFERYPGLAKMRGIILRQARERFQELDRKILKLHQQSLAAHLTRRPIDQGVQTPQRKNYTGLVLIRNELSKKQRHVPIRTLLDRAGPSIQQMKPCFMMSPLSVAQFLKPGGLRFDLLVIDEASQMRPEEALGSIARADQLAIVGDPMQLPPTSFFDTADHVIGADEDVEEIVDSESILDLALRTYHPARELRWHYRSRHESLIAFSNRQFYDDRLIVFPSPLDPDKTKREPKFGVFHHFVEGKYKSSLNIPEAQAVAKAAVAFMHEQPDSSLGVVTLNHAQREFLLGEIDSLIARDQFAEEYKQKWDSTLEPFFVKNLENVQGDERDVIFISTVYGPDANTGVVMNRFGPVNSNVGHRRLNVLFTRAKERVDIFTSMRSTDVRVSDASSRGVKALKSYLEYAETGRLEQGVITARDFDSDFEIYVRDKLVQHGFEVVKQVGVAGYFIDLAIRHPTRTGYLLGIECDGATYHSSKSARDRDRLREEVLTGLKWNIYRIWSTDWFSNPEQEFSRLLNHIEQLVAGKSAIN